MQQTRKKALVIGAAGFVGRYLVSHLHDEKGMDVVVTKLPNESLSPMPAKVLDKLGQHSLEKSAAGRGC